MNPKEIEYCEQLIKDVSKAVGIDITKAGDKNSRRRGNRLETYGVAIYGSIAQAKTSLNQTQIGSLVNKSRCTILRANTKLIPEIKLHAPELYKIYCSLHQGITIEEHNDREVLRARIKELKNILKGIIKEKDRGSLIDLRILIDEAKAKI